MDGQRGGLLNSRSLYFLSVISYYQDRNSGKENIMVVPSPTGQICPMCKQPKMLPDAWTPGMKPTCRCDIGLNVHELFSIGKIVKCNCCGATFHTSHTDKCPHCIEIPCSQCDGTDFTEVSDSGLEKKEDREKEHWRRVQKSFMPPVV